MNKLNKGKLPNKELYRVSKELYDGLYIVPLSIKHKRIYPNDELATKIKEEGERLSIFIGYDMTAYKYRNKTYVVTLRDGCFLYYVGLLANSFYLCK